MAPSTSEEEDQQGRVDAVAPAALEEQLASSFDEMKKKKMEEALSLLGSYRARCSEILEAARGRRATDDLELRCIAFLEKELGVIVTSLSAPLSPRFADHEMMEWLHGLTDATSHNLARALDEADPQRQTLLRGAVQWFRRRNRYPYRLMSATEQLYRLAEHPCRYTHFPKDISRLGLPSQVIEHVGDLFPVGIDQWMSCFPHPMRFTMFYMMMYPYGYKFEKGRFAWKWTHECATVVGGRELAEAAAEHYFQDLVDYWNFHTRPAANSRCNNPDEADAFQWNVNHHEHKLLASISAELGVVFTIDMLNILAAASARDHGNETPGMIARRLALHHQDDSNISHLLQKIDLSQTRSLAVSGAASGVRADKFVNLVVLDVEGWENFGDHDLVLVCKSKMFFLKYLSIRNTRVSKLPAEIKELRNLRILDASYTKVTQLSLGVFEETYLLERLDLRCTPIRQLTLPKQILGPVDSLEALLLGGEGMIISSSAKATRVPHNIRRFLNLSTLATIDLSEQPASFVKALGDLQNLKVIALTWSFHQSSDRDYSEALISSIQKWECLESLTIHCGLGCSMEFLGSLSDISANLETFKVTVGRFAGVPQWFQRIRCLSFVQITVCKLGTKDLEVLRGLPKLKRLILGLDFVATEATVIENEGFHELQRLSIDCPVPWLTFMPGAMPKLTYLQLDFRACLSPTRVPSGISNLSKLKEVALWYNVRYANSSSVKMTVDAVMKEVAKCRTTKMISLFINGLEQYDVQSGAGAENVVQEVHEITEA